jgi:hypothetical protein
MKIPKIKYWCTALTPDQYREFEATRCLAVDARITIDISTGVASGRTCVPLTATVTGADQLVRDRIHWTQPLYVLRIPADLLDRRHIHPAGHQIWEYRATLHLPHCGVEQVALAP